MNRALILTCLATAFVFLSLPALACPASYVKGVGTSNTATGLDHKASQVAGHYLWARGIDPGSPAGDIIHPYLVGTSLVDDGYGRSWGRSNNPTLHRWRREEVTHSLDKPIDACVQDALECAHHTMHFGDGVDEAGRLPTYRLVEKHGG